MRGDLRSSADIRMDCGDLRYRYFGIPLVYDSMPEPQRSKLLALSAKSKVLKDEWRTCATFPRQYSNNEDRACRSWYEDAVVWAKEDPEMARMLLEDVTAYLRAEDDLNGSSKESSWILGSFLVVDEKKDAWAVKPNWRQDPAMLDYLACKHYSLPTTQP